MRTHWARRHPDTVRYPVSGSLIVSDTDVISHSSGDISGKNVSASGTVACICVIYKVSANGMVWAYISPPPTTKHGFPTDAAAANASSTECTGITPSGRSAPSPLVMTMLVLPGSGRPMDRNVFLPIMTVPPNVVRLKCLRSSDMCHGMVPDMPMALLSEIAAMIFFSMGQIYAEAESNANAKHQTCHAAAP